ncbi:MAG: fucose isomerase, partial [Oscillospiraceae bacterium]|nr:fucose isomerase [Oscillospiraceae bacterium]
MEKKCLDVRVNVKPIFCVLSHKYYYEGPCRMAGGEALQPGFDDVLNGQISNGIQTGLKYACPEDVGVVMEANTVTVTDDWDMKDEYLEALLREQEKTDVYFVFTSFGSDRLWREFGRRCGKPVIIVPNLWNPTKSAYYYNTGVEVYVPYDWEEVTDYLKALRARKAIAQTNVLLVTRFSDTMCTAGADDGFYNLDLVTEKFGAKFRPVNFHELLDEMKPLPEGGNPTTPGRATPNLTEEEIRELEDYADEL